MKRLSMFLMCLLAMMVAGKKLVAQEITITLEPGWNWISYPNAEAMDVASALNGFEPMEGDRIKSRYTSSKYSRGRWSGGVTHFIPGWGFMYYSNRDEFVSFVFNKPPIPTGTLSVTTGELANITSTTAACGGSAVSNDGTSILMKGVCWATHPQPTTNDSYTEDGSGPGDFTSTMTALDPETEYYVRAYAVSVKGINYGEELSFTTAQQGVLNGLFTVNGNGDQVYFSQGNLQYQASTNTWRFALNQWETVGLEDNENASATFDGWIDKYDWATSGYPHIEDCYQPWSSCGMHLAYGAESYNLYDESGQADWGYNAISNGGNVENSGWRTVKGNEWSYLFNHRTTLSGIRYAKATVNGEYGVILFPDDWNADWYAVNNFNETAASYNSNIISGDVWESVFEAHGAVLLPQSSDYSDIRYCSASKSYTGQIWILFFADTFLTSQVSTYVGKYAVRLVRPAQANTSLFH